MFKYAFDLHGTLDKDESLREMMKSVTIPWEVYVISGTHYEEIEDKLHFLDLYKGHDYDHIISTIDWMKSRYPDGLVWEGKNGWYAPDHIWWSSKAKICKELGINIMIDNDDRYGAYFTGDCKFMHFK